ncbi:MAG: hypothetical protein ACJAXG_002221 [Celeribacter sp.]|jgi:hypothetical protein
MINNAGFGGHDIKNDSNDPSEINTFSSDALS